MRAQGLRAPDGARGVGASPRFKSPAAFEPPQDI